jgi:hypothetical protein
MRSKNLVIEFLVSKNWQSSGSVNFVEIYKKGQLK